MSLRDELQRLHDRDGELSPAEVLEEAKSTESPLHRYFEWDDSAAAARWRMRQAGDLIRRVRVTVVTSPDETISVRQYVSVSRPGEGSSYVDTEVALASEGTRNLVLEQLIKEIAALRRKYRSLVDYDGFLQALAVGEDGESAA